MIARKSCTCREEQENRDTRIHISPLRSADSAIRRSIESCEFEIVEPAQEIREFPTVNERINGIRNAQRARCRLITSCFQVRIRALSALHFLCRGGQARHESNRTLCRCATLPVRFGRPSLLASRAPYPKSGIRCFAFD